MLDIFFPALLGVIAAQASPGPNFLAVASIGLSQGRRCALFAASGVATGVYIWAFAFSVLPDFFAEGIMFSLIFQVIEETKSFL